MIKLNQRRTHASNVHGTLERVDRIVVHDSGRSPFATDEGELSYLAREHENRYCYHAYIFQTGEIYQLADWSALLWHVNGSEIDGRRVDLNPRSVGFAFGNTNLPSSVYPKAQYQAGVKLAKYLMLMFGLTPDHVVGHKEVSAYRGKSDPNAFDMHKFRADVAAFNFEPSKPEIAVAPPEGLDLGNGWRVKVEPGAGPRIVQSVDANNKVLFIRTGN